MGSIPARDKIEVLDIGRKRRCVQRRLPWVGNRSRRQGRDGIGVVGVGWRRCARVMFP